MITVHFPTGYSIVYETATDYRHLPHVCGVPVLEIRQERKDKVDLVLGLVQARDIALTFGAKGWSAQ